MEDLERYADYNDTEDDAPKSRHPVAIILRVVAALLILAVVGVIGFRLILFGYYPKPMKTLFFDDELTAFYNAAGGNLGALSQKIRVPYDDDVRGNFFADNLMIIPGAGELQFTLRYNVSALDDINEEYGTAYTADEPDLLSFRLTDNYGKVYEGGAVLSDAKMMYRYKKLAFHGIVFFDTGSGIYPEWMRLEITVKGQTDPYAYICVYENNADYAAFTDYLPGKGERP